MKTTMPPYFRLRLRGGHFLAALIVAALIPSAALAASASLAANPATDQSQRIPLDQLGAVAGQQYHGDGLTVRATPEGARLRCVFQRLEGEATPAGLWLTSTAANAATDRFRIVAAEVGRAADFGVRRQSAAATPLFEGEQLEEFPFASESGVALRFPPQSKMLPSRV